jgi:hypothetical protein
MGAPRLPVTANIAHMSPIVVTLMMEAISSSEKSALSRAIRRNIQEGIVFPVKAYLQNQSLLSGMPTQGVGYKGGEARLVILDFSKFSHRSY